MCFLGKFATSVDGKGRRIFDCGLRNAEFRDVRFEMWDLRLQIWDCGLGIFQARKARKGREVGRQGAVGSTAQLSSSFASYGCAVIRSLSFAVICCNR
jgi:hypothetical protein